jgi:hypothetical protein
MDTNTLMQPGVLIAIGAGVVVLLVLVGWLVERKRRSGKLREKFGPEYERVLAEQGDARKTEALLAEREKRVSKFSIRHLTMADRERYVNQWAAVQRRFVDDPAMAVMEADSLVTALMAARGYPMTDFEQRAEDISVNYPRVVQNYRAARLIVGRHGKGQATTEDMRQAMVHYRSLFDEMVEAPAGEKRGVVHERVAS